MKQKLAVISLAAAAAWAQTQPGGAAASQIRKPGTAPPPASYRDLKYPPPRPLTLPRIEASTLSNGLRLYLLEDHELPMVSATAMIRTGNVFDPRDEVGLAYATGQLLTLGGAASQTGDQLRERMDRIGGVMESRIGETFGIANFSALRENSDELLRIVKAVLTSAEFRPDKIDAVKQQLRAAIAHRNDDTAVIAAREFTNTVYGKDTPYGWWLDYAGVDRIDREDLLSFYHRYFFPKNILLAVEGDFDSNQMKTDIEKLFADWRVEQPSVAEFPKAAGGSGGGLYLAQKRDTLQASFVAGQLGGEYRDPDCPALQVIADILGGGPQSRLQRRLGSDLKSLTAAWAAKEDHPGLFQISGTIDPFHTVTILKTVREEVARIRKEEVSDEELQQAKDAVWNRLIFDLDTSGKALANRLVQEYFGYPADFILQYQRALEKVTRADVLRAAKEHLDPDKMTVVVSGNPLGFEQPLNTIGSPIEIAMTMAPPRPEAVSGDAAAEERGKALLARMQEAVGGAGKLAAVKDFTQEAAYESAVGGAPSTRTDRWISPGFYRQDSKTAAGDISLYIGGTSAWIVTVRGSGPLTAAQLQQVQGDLFRLYFPLLLSDRLPGRKVTALDDRTVQISNDSGHFERLVCDPATGLPQSVLYHLVNGADQFDVLTSYSDFREQDGLKLPYQLTIQVNGQKYMIATIKQYRLNSGLKVEDLEKRP